MPSGDPALSGSTEQKRALDHRAFVAIVGATFVSVASVVLMVPFFASHGAEVNPLTTVILGGQIVLFGLWTHAVRAYALAKGYARFDRLLPAWTLLVLGVVAASLRRRPISAVVRGKIVFSGECALTFLILGLVGAGLTIAIAVLPDLGRRALLRGANDGEVSS